MSTRVAFVPLSLVALVLAGGVILLVLFLTRRRRRTESTAASPAGRGLLIGVILAGLVLLTAGAAVVMHLRLNVSEEQALREKADRVASVYKEHDIASTSSYSNAWTDTHKPDTGFPSWVTEKALLEPSTDTVTAAGRRFSFAAPAPGDRLAGYSNFAASASDAHHEAWVLLLTRLEARTLPQLAFHKAHEYPRFPESRIRGEIRAVLESKRQRLALQTYTDEVNVAGIGTAHRAALCATYPPPLIDTVATESMDRLMAQETAARDASRRVARTWAYYVGGAIFLLLVILSIYLFLNAHTKGYYAWPLRVAATLIYVFSVIAFVMVLRVFSGH